MSVVLQSSIGPINVCSSPPGQGTQSCVVHSTHITDRLGDHVINRVAGLKVVKRKEREREKGRERTRERERKRKTKKKKKKKRERERLF